MEEIRTLIYNFRSRPSRLFLLDAAGAFITAFMLGIVFTYIQEHIRMPPHILIALAVIASIFSIYSLLCSTFLKLNWRPFLTAIAVANSLYCLMTAVLIALFYQQLTVFAFIYFLGEIIVVLSLVLIEFKVVFSKHN